MTALFYVLPAADRDLDDLAAYLAKEVGLASALRFYDAANATFAHIARSPGLGERRVSINERISDLRVRRIEGFENHLVFYRASAEGVAIVRVLHGARNINRIIAEHDTHADDAP